MCFFFYKHSLVKKTRRKSRKYVLVHGVMWDSSTLRNVDLASGNFSFHQRKISFCSIEIHFKSLETKSLKKSHFTTYIASEASNFYFKHFGSKNSNYTFWLAFVQWPNLMKHFFFQIYSKRMKNPPFCRSFVLAVGHSDDAIKWLIFSGKWLHAHAVKRPGVRALPWRCICLTIEKKFAAAELRDDDD